MHYKKQIIKYKKFQIKYDIFIRKYINKKVIKLKKFIDIIIFKIRNQNKNLKQ